MTLEAAVNKLRKAEDSEGAMLKVADSTYPLGGKTTEWAKLKNLVEVHVKVTDIFNYSV